MTDLKKLKKAVKPFTIEEAKLVVYLREIEKKPWRYGPVWHSFNDIQGDWTDCSR